MLISFYSYPKIFRRDKPSELRIDKQKLKQNSAQMRCLLLNLPHILNKYRDHEELRSVWNCVRLLILIFQTVSSIKLDRKRVDNLRQNIQALLTELKSVFGFEAFSDEN